MMETWIKTSLPSLKVYFDCKHLHLILYSPYALGILKEPL